MNNSDIKLIAEGLGLEIRHINDNDKVFIEEDSGKWKGAGNRIFNPLENWSDCGIVLEALVKETTKLGRSLKLFDWGNNPSEWGWEVEGAHITRSHDLKQAICQAYLSILKGE